MAALGAITRKAILNIPEIGNNMDVFYYIKNNKIDENYMIYLKEETSFNDDVISDWLNISVKTLRSYRKPKTNLKENLKEHLVLILSLYEHGKEVFESSEHFDNWLDTNNFYFDNKPPKDFVATVSGIKFIDDQLTSIEYGDNV